MKVAIRVASAACAMLVVAGCGGGGSGGAASGGGGSGSTPLTSLPPPVRAFHSVTAGSGIAYSVGFTRPGWDPNSEVTESTIGGVAAGDCDGDGDIDLFIAAGDAQHRANRLYLNQLAEVGNGLLFIDHAQAAGLAYTRDAGGMQNWRHSGPVFADMDGDGDLDLFVGSLFRDPVKVFRNNGSCEFTDVTATSGLGDPDDPNGNGLLADQTISAAFGDYDLDGDLDLYLTHWGTPDSAYSDMDGPYTEHLWQNVSDDAAGIRFVNVSVPSNVTAIQMLTRQIPNPLSGRFLSSDASFTPAFAHVDDDLWPDIAVAGDWATSQLMLNNGDGTFRDSELEVLRSATYGMGASLGDFDADGDLDWFVTSIAASMESLTGNRLFVNQTSEADPGPLLLDASQGLGIREGGWGWASCFLDIDNDTDLDIYHTNGWAQRAFAGDIVFGTDSSVAFVNDSGVYKNHTVPLGLNNDFSGRGLVCADFDGDGDIDIFELTDRQPNSGVLWENRTAAAGNNFLSVKLRGLAPNTEAAGARIYVEIDEQTQMREVMIGSNYISQNPAVQYFGLGAAAVVDEVRVVWPARMSGSEPEPEQPAPTVLTGVSANQLLEIAQDGE